MSLDADPGGLRNVVVGATYDEAATVFGRYFDGAVLLTYDDFGEQADLGLLGSLGLVAGEGLTQVLPHVLAHQSMRKSGSVRILVGLPPDLRGRDRVRAALAGHPELDLLPVTHAGPQVLLELVAADPAADGTSSSIDLDPLAAAPPPSGPRRRDRTPTPAASVGIEGSPAAAPMGRADTLRERARRRPQAAAAAAVGLSAVLVVLLLLLVAVTDWGLTGVVVLAGALVVAGQVLLLMAVLAVLRLLREQNHDSDLLQNRADRLLQLTREGHRRQRQRAATVESSLAALAPTPGRVLALGRLLARSSASALERVRPSDADHAAADAEFLLACVETLLRDRPDLVLCCGGGQVAVALGLAADRNGLSARITLVEGDARAADAVRATVHPLHLDDRVEVRTADVGRATHEEDLAGLRGVALLVHGETDGAGAARPAFAAVATTLADTCTVLVAPRCRSEADQSAPDWAALLPGFEVVGGAAAHAVRLARAVPGQS